MIRPRPRALVPFVALFLLFSYLFSVPALAQVSVAEPPVAAASSPAPAETPDLEIKNARTPLPDVVSGGQPTVEELGRAAELGYRTVINLRTEGEEIPFDEEEAVTGLGMGYVHLPVAGAEGITAENAKQLHQALETAERPLILHCGSGNRVGALLALARHQIEGATPEAALEYGLESGLTRLEPVVRQKLGVPEPEEP